MTDIYQIFTIQIFFGLPGVILVAVSRQKENIKTYSHYMGKETTSLQDSHNWCNYNVNFALKHGIAAKR
jgi:hypothetical protein